ncbi:hypothetical protein H0H93_002920 [Arthromyces matolae]|nr:hypothetical protein H0H93_002920 [Arthromyces matolae]
MIFKAKLVEAVAVACIFHVALGIPIHANGPVDRGTTQPYPLQPRDPQTQIQSRDAFQRFDTPKNPNPHGSSTSIDPNVLSIRDSLDPRSPVGNTPQSLPVPPVEEPDRRPIGLLTALVPGPHVDKLAEAVKSDSFRTRISKDLLKEWEEYVAEYPALWTFYERVFCMTLETAELRFLVESRNHFNESPHRFGSRKTLEGLDSNQTCSDATREAVRKLLRRIDVAPSKEKYEEAVSQTNEMIAEEQSKTNTRLLTGWRLRRQLILQMCNSPDPEESRKHCDEIVMNQTSYLMHYFPLERAPLYPAAVVAAAETFRKFLHNTHKMLNGGNEASIDLTNAGNKRGRDGMQPFRGRGGHV